MPFVRRIYDEAKEADRGLLRKRARKLSSAELKDPLTQQLIDDMFLTMYEAPGIGLAAPQVGTSRQLAVVDLQDGNPEHGPLVLVNPKFLSTEGRRETTEGCLFGTSGLRLSIGSGRHLEIASLQIERTGRRGRSRVLKY